MRQGLTGGVLPLSAVLATEEIYSSFLGLATGRSSTATRTPRIRCAPAALANLELMDERATVDHAAWIGRTLGDLPAVGRRRAGGRSATDRHDDRDRGQTHGDRTGLRICTAMRDLGVITRPLGDVVILMPPLGIAEPELQQMASALNHGLDQVYGAAS